jgi:hypothetical protein
MSTLAEAITGACLAARNQTAVPFNKAIRRALSAIQWRLVSPSGQYAGIDNGVILGACVLTDAAHAVVFDGRDNEAMKAAYYSAVLGVPMSVELISFGA